MTLPKIRLSQSKHMIYLINGWKKMMHQSRRLNHHHRLHSPSILILLPLV